LRGDKAEALSLMATVEMRKVKNKEEIPRMYSYCYIGVYYHLEEYSYALAKAKTI